MLDKHIPQPVTLDMWWNPNAVDQDAAYPCVTAWLKPAERWNGWVCPAFEKSQADRLLAITELAPVAWTPG